MSKTFLGRENIMLLETVTVQLASLPQLFENIHYILMSKGSSMDEDEGGLGRAGVSSSSKHVSVW